MRFRATVQSSTPGVGTPGSQFLQQLSTPGMSMPGRHFGSVTAFSMDFVSSFRLRCVPNSVCWTFCFTKHVSAQHVSTPGTVPPGMHSGVVSQAALSGQHIVLPRSGTPGWQDGFIAVPACRRNPAGRRFAARVDARELRANLAFRVPIANAVATVVYSWF